MTAGTPDRGHDLLLSAPDQRGLAAATAVADVLGGDGSDRSYRVLLVEDDDGDALLVEELLADEPQPIELRRVRSIGEAVSLLDAIDCALVDLGLPDAYGMAAVERLRDVGTGAALVVLTGNHDRARGLAALASGAQDYLVKGEVDGAGLVRSIRYAVERRRAELAQLQLHLAGRRQAENERLARGLLPRLDVGGHGIEAATRYEPGGRDALLGGDFLDAIELPDGTVRAVIGDVCGHGPDEAALGVALRIAWRTAVLLGAPPADVLQGVDTVLRHESHLADVFATVCDLTVDAGAHRCTIRLHGHPPPLLVRPGVGWLHAGPPSPPLGVGTYTPAQPATLELPPCWALIAMTDGIYEGRNASGGRIGMDAFAPVVASVPGWEAARPVEALDRLVDRVTELNGCELDDDVALLWLGSER